MSDHCHQSVAELNNYSDCMTNLFLLKLLLQLVFFGLELLLQQEDLASMTELQVLLLPLLVDLQVSDFLLQDLNIVSVTLNAAHTYKHSGYSPKQDHKTS